MRPIRHLRLPRGLLGKNRTSATLVRSQGAGSTGEEMGRQRVAARTVHDVAPGTGDVNGSVDQTDGCPGSLAIGSRTQHVSLRRAAPASGRTARWCTCSESNRAKPGRSRPPGSARTGAQAPALGAPSPGEPTRNRTAPARVAISPVPWTQAHTERPMGVGPNTSSMASSSRHRADGRRAGAEGRTRLTRLGRPVGPGPRPREGPLPGMRCHRRVEPDSRTEPGVQATPPAAVCW
jgi:hypothetical protein